MFCPKISFCVVAGVLEVVKGIPAGTHLVLNSPMFPNHLDYVELIYTPGEASATIRTKKPLDAKAFHEVSCLTNTHVQKSEFKNGVATACLISPLTIKSLCVFQSNGKLYYLYKCDGSRVGKMFI